MRGHRLAYDAARIDLRAARGAAASARSAAKLARAEGARVVAERAAGRASAADVAEAKDAQRRAEREVKAAMATLRVRRHRLEAARAEIPRPSDVERHPLTRLVAEHDAIIGRWMEYETDPAKLISFPAMSDAGDPATGVFLAAMAAAQGARPALDAGAVTPEEFLRYRNAVAVLGSAFDRAERSARGRAGRHDESEPAAWQEAAQQVISVSADAIARATAAAGAAVASWTTREPGGTRGKGDGWLRRQRRQSDEEATGSQ